MKLNRLDLLLKEITDPIVQENLWRIRQYLESLTVNGVAGPPGPTGATGPQGPAGADGADGNSVAMFTRFCCGKMDDFDPNCYNEINCCELPIVTTRLTMNMGTLDELCD